MKRKLVVGILTGAILLGSAGTIAFAQSNGATIFDFEQMQPHMQEMHPNLSTQELEQMYQSCHGGNGMMGSTQNRINNF